ncbi:hypothetical protein [Streptomyces phaeoluteigriseus]
MARDGLADQVKRLGNIAGSRLEHLAADETWLVKALETVAAPGEIRVGAQAPEGEPVEPQEEPVSVAAKNATARKTVAKKKAEAVADARQEAQAAAGAAVCW